MDTQARIEAAKARLDAGRAVLVRAKEAGPPCTGCRYYFQKIKGPRGGDIARCSHLAYKKQVHSVVTGEVRSHANQSVLEARANDGLCGPEGILFEPIPTIWTAIRGLLRNSLR